MAWTRQQGLVPYIGSLRVSEDLLDANKTAREEARRQLHKHFASNIE